jgi:hypothetical protein
MGQFPFSLLGVGQDNQLILAPDFQEMNIFWDWYFVVIMLLYFAICKTKVSMFFLRAKSAG